MVFKNFAEFLFDLYEKPLRVIDSSIENSKYIEIDLSIHNYDLNKLDVALTSTLDASVHSFKNNANYGDYGPTIILKHNIKNVEFHTLYGHLSLSSIIGLKIGKKIKQGKQIGVLGDTTVNGNYPPHSHFQIIKDIQGFKGDYLGVCSLQNLAFYLSNCPNPNVILKL